MMNMNFDLYFIDEKYAEVFDLFYEQVSNELNMQQQLEFNKINKKSVSETEEFIAAGNVFESEICVNDYDQLKDLCESILEEFNVKKSDLYPITSNIEESYTDAKENNKSSFSISIYVEKRLEFLFTLLYCQRIEESNYTELKDMDYQEYIDQVCDQYNDVIFDHIGGEGEYLDIYFAFNKPRDKKTGQYLSEGKESQVIRLDKKVAEFKREKIEELLNILIDNKLEIDDAIHVLLRSPEILFPNNFQDEQTVIADYKICFQYSEGVDYLDIDSLKFQEDEIADLLNFLDRKLRDVREFHVQKKQLEEWKKE